MNTLHLGEQSIDLSRPRVMAILNVTPDSFYAGSRTDGPEAIRARVAQAVEGGADLLDVGGYSSRPGAADVSPEEEIRRLDNALEIIRRDFSNLPVSLDTFRGEVAVEIVRRHGPCLINDITGGSDPDLVALAAEQDLPYIAMHMRGTPQTMQQMTEYGDFVPEVLESMHGTRDRLHAAGVRQVVLDPGFGFSKTLSQNYELLAAMHRLSELDCPVLAGISRKSMIYKPLGITPGEALSATCALHWECLRQGASILRVHDAREASEVIRLYGLFRSAE